MSYSELLKGYIKKSGYKLDEISEKLEDYNLTASKEYLSRLQNGKTKPASKELNKALAKITGGDEEKLIFEAYMEKAPKEVRDVYKQVVDMSFSKPLTLRDRILNDPKFYEIMRESFLGELDGEEKERISELIDTPEKYVEFFDHPKFNPDFLDDEIKTNDSFKYLALNNLLSETIMKNGSNVNLTKKLNRVKNIIRIPVLGSVQAGEPILANEHLERYIDYPKPDNYNEDDLFFLRVKGDSMINSRIQEGDLVLVKIQPEVENGEIAVVNVNGDEATLKKVKKLENGQTILIPSNDKYDPIIIDNEKARVIGKVIQVIFEP